MNSYDKILLRPLKIMKILMAVYALFNIFLPLYNGMIIGYHKIYCYVFIIIMGSSIISAHGYIKQFVPLLPCILTRIIQFIANKDTLILISFILLCSLDIGINVYLMMFRYRYEYIEE